MKNQPPSTPEEPQHDAHVVADREYFRELYRKQDLLFAKHDAIVRLRSFVRLSLQYGRMDIELDPLHKDSSADRQRIREILEEPASDPRNQILDTDYDIWCAKPEKNR